MRIGVFLCLLCVSGVALPHDAGAAGRAAAKSPKERLAAAEAAYDDYRYDAAAKLFEGVVEDPGLTDASKRQQARLLLAFSYVWMHKDANAKEQLRRLFRENVDFSFDRDAHHPDLVRFFDNEHSAYVGSATPPPAKTPTAPATSAAPPTAPAPSPPTGAAPPSPPPSPPPGAAVSAPTRTLVTVPAAPPTQTQIVITPVTTTGDAHPWARIFPGGIGHFLNHDYGAGSAFLTSELVLVALNVTSAVLWSGLHAADGNFRRNTNPVPLQATMDATALAAIAVTAFDIIDAFAWSPERGRASLTGSAK